MRYSIGTTSWHTGMCMAKLGEIYEVKAPLRAAEIAIASCSIAELVLRTHASRRQVRDRTEPGGFASRRSGDVRAGRSAAGRAVRRSFEEHAVRPLTGDGRRPRQRIRPNPRTAGRGPSAAGLGRA